MARSHSALAFWTCSLSGEIGLHLSHGTDHDLSGTTRRRATAISKKPSLSDSGAKAKSAINRSHYFFRWGRPLLTLPISFVLNHSYSAADISCTDVSFIFGLSLNCSLRLRMN